MTTLVVLSCQVLFTLLSSQFSHLAKKNANSQLANPNLYSPRSQGVVIDRFTFDYSEIIAGFKVIQGFKRYEVKEWETKMCGFSSYFGNLPSVYHNNLIMLQRDYRDVCS